MALGLTQSPKEMSTRNFPWRLSVVGVKGWQSHRHLRADCLENVYSLDISQPYGPPRPIAGQIFMPTKWPLKRYDVDLAPCCSIT
jgi:hypothetical protein